MTNVALIGKNSGIGFQATIKLVEIGAKRVILGVRSTTKGEAAKRDIEQKTGRSGVIEVWQLDMLDYDSIKAFSDRAKAEIENLDYVILNAGVMLTSFSTSSYGWEKTLQVNVISTTLLALHLLPKLKSNNRPGFTPVLEMIGSGLHQTVCKLNVKEADDPSQDPLKVYNIEKNFDGSQGQYTISKLFLMYIYARLAQTDRSGSSRQAYVQVVCPGFTQSGLGNTDTSGMLRVAHNAFKTMLGRSTEDGAKTYIAGLTLGEKGHGMFWQYDRIHTPAPMLVDANAKTREERVWTATIEALRKDVVDIDHLVFEALQ